MKMDLRRSNKRGEEGDKGLKVYHRRSIQKGLEERAKGGGMFLEKGEGPKALLL